MLLIAFYDNLFVVESSFLIPWLLLIMHRRNSCQIQCHEAVFLCLLKGFIISALLGLVCFELTLVCDNWEEPLPCGCCASSTALVVGRQFGPTHKGLFLGFPLIHWPVCVPSTSIGCCSSPFEVRPWETFSFVLVALLFRILEIHRNFMVFFFYFC